VRELLELASDKELEFNGQLSREVVVRANGASVTEVVLAAMPKLGANMLVVRTKGDCGA
jgi:hypothetical protein